MSIDVDGTALAGGNISEVTVSNWGNVDKPAFSFYVTSYEKVGSVTKLTRLMAKESPEAKQLVAEGEEMRPSKVVAGFMEAAGRTKAQQQIEAWFKSTRR